MVRMMVESVEASSFSHGAFLKRDEKWCKSAKIPSTKAHLDQVMEFAKQIPPEKFKKIMEDGFKLKTEKLSFEDLKDNEKQKALQAGFKVKAAVGIVLFVVLCFATEAIPLPMVAFCIGIIAMCTGIVDRHNIAGLYWSDATWFIMGSLMFAAAFVKTGVDKRIAMMMFGQVEKPGHQMDLAHHHLRHLAADHVHVGPRPRGHVPPHRHPPLHGLLVGRRAR